MSEPRRCLLCARSEPFSLMFERGAYRMVRCPDCHLVFQHPQPTPESLAGAYYHDPGFTKALLGPLREITLERAREKLSLLGHTGALRPGIRLLDVGCSSGAWLEIAAAESIEGVGVELGSDTAAAARERGLDVRTGTLEEALPGLEGERFDLITFWDVLEHLHDPHRALVLAAGLLAPGGMVAATFPNVEGWYPQVTYRLFARRTGVWEYPELPVHLYDFAPDTARRLLSGAGFEATCVRSFETPFEFYRETTLSAERLGAGRRARLLRLGFEATRVAVYPLARVFGRGNSLFIAGRQAQSVPARPLRSGSSTT